MEKLWHPEVLGYPIFQGSLEALIGGIVEAAENSPQHVVTLNPEMIMQGEADPAFAKILKEAEWPIPDGAGVVWALKRQGITQPRLPGIEVAEALLQHLHETQNPRGAAFIGAHPDVINLLPAALLRRFPKLEILFTRDGYFPLEDEEKIAEEMAAMRPKLVLVALGVPRQEMWIARHRARFAVDTIFIGVGGSFNVWVGAVQRAPAIMRALHLEWAWRFALEPWRIKRAGEPLLRFVFRVLQSR